MMRELNSSKRDDSAKSRLASFLLEEGDLKIISIKIIKYPIFKIKTETNQLYIIKGYKQFSIIDKQWDFFSKVSQSFITKFIAFPNKRLFLEGFGYYWAMQPYLHAKKLDYHEEIDRQAALETLSDFHEVTRGIRMDTELKSTKIIGKWFRRLEKWRQTKQALINTGNASLYSEVEKVMLERIDLYHLENIPKLESNDASLLTWNHGDVASHNFLRDNRNRIYMIDFDLLASAPPLYDYIQLCQRFLPYIDHSLDQLYTYIHTYSLKEWRLLLIGVTVPTDLIREWWYYMTRPHTEAEIKAYIEQFSMSWQERKKFVDQVDTMLK
ncbi:MULTISPECIES: aminoglycoside phosphotransferase family protein [Paraliobacillus]|uniref:aminoglycoside phosphotransferase family protein n=1 Tax=Paraliobacillus TaxID=200903 RepID=UPI000DD3B18B|nr:MULTISPECIES: aminoglycoside phosphotransferase family protein [Paraliobacillus]